MRTSRFAVLALALLASPAAAQDAKAVIEKAVQAHGGADRIDRYPAAIVETKGTVFQLGHVIPFTSRSLYQLPDKCKNVIELEGLNAKRSITRSLSGGEERLTVNGEVQKVSEPQTREFREETYLQNVVRLTPLLKDPGYTLTDAGTTQVNGKPAVGVKVSAKDHKDVTLFFDKGIGLLVKVDRTGLDSSGKEIKQERIYSDYKSFDGVMHPLKTAVLHDGQKFMESETVDFKPLEKADPREFAAEGK